MKTAIVYYSHSGNTKCVAQLLANRLRREKVDVDLIEIRAARTPGSLKPGYAAWRQRGFPIKRTELDLGKYELVVVGAPVWFGKPAPFINTFVGKAQNIKAKKSAFFTTGATMPDTQGKALKVFRSVLEGGGLRTIERSLALKMKKGDILVGGEDIQRFVKAMLSE